MISHCPAASCNAPSRRPGSSAGFRLIQVEACISSPRPSCRAALTDSRETADLNRYASHQQTQARSSCNRRQPRTASSHPSRSRPKSRCSAAPVPAGYRGAVAIRNKASRTAHLPRRGKRPRWCLDRRARLISVIPLLFGLPVVSSPLHIAFLELVIDPVLRSLLRPNPQSPMRPPRDRSRCSLLASCGGVVSSFQLSPILFIAALHRGLPSRCPRARLSLHRSRPMQ